MKFGGGLFALLIVLLGVTFGWADVYLRIMSRVVAP